MGSEIVLYCRNCGNKLSIDTKSKMAVCNFCENIREVMLEVSYLNGFAAGFSSCSDAMSNHLSGNIDQILENLRIGFRNRGE